VEQKGQGKLLKIGFTWAPLLVLLLIGCGSNVEEPQTANQDLLGTWMNKAISTGPNSTQPWIHIFKFENSGKILSDYWLLDSNGNVHPSFKNGSYVTEKYQVQGEDSIQFTIQKDIDSYRQIATRYEVVGDSLFLWNRKDLYYHVENGRYIAKSDDSDYVETRHGYAQKASAFEFQ
jgi:hypothetical protein